MGIAGGSFVEFVPVCGQDEGIMGMILVGENY
jgi:hypothetical protein